GGLWARIRPMPSSRRARPNCVSASGTALPLSWGSKMLCRSVYSSRGRPNRRSQRPNRSRWVSVVPAGGKRADTPLGEADNTAVKNNSLSPASQSCRQGAAHLDHLAKPGTPRPAAAVRFATALTLPQPGGQQPATQGLGADRQPLLGQLRAGEGGAEVGVTLAVGCQHR